MATTESHTEAFVAHLAAIVHDFLVYLDPHCASEDGTFTFYLKRIGQTICILAFLVAVWNDASMEKKLALIDMHVHRVSMATRA